MNSLLARRLLFLIGCMGSRFGLSYVAYRASPMLLQGLGFLALFPAVGFWYLYLTGSRKTGAEVFGDQIWWNHLRPFHGLMYLVFAVLALFQVKGAWMVLFLDTCVGLAAFTKFHLTYKQSPKVLRSWV